jgi:hypothetical protein
LSSALRDLVDRQEVVHETELDRLIREILDP